jgi:hypothetical protein
MGIFDAIKSLLGVDGVAESLPGGLGDIVQGATEGGLQAPTA